MRSTNIQSNSRSESISVVDFNIDILEAQFRNSFSPTLRRVKPAPTVSYCASRAGGAMPARRADANDAGNSAGRKRRATPEDVEIGRKIRALRLERGLSQSG